MCKLIGTQFVVYTLHHKKEIILGVPPHTKFSSFLLERITNVVGQLMYQRKISST